ncbi:MAG: dockerin type I repeat-containing protein, partial [Lachnospiraceae bacterium]|nr:dockerin type I repeat-containing protein [Lachnospiraceae bacterium]
IDATKLNKHLLATEELAYVQQIACDVNGDGYVDNKDAAMISRYLVGKESIE